MEVSRSPSTHNNNYILVIYTISYIDSVLTLDFLDLGVLAGAAGIGGIEL